MGRGERRVLENYCLSIGCTLFFCVRRTQIIKLEKRTFNLFPIYGGIFFDETIYYYLEVM